MSRTYVITGAASGIGLGTRKLLESRGEKVIGVDLAGSDIDADLATQESREALPGLVERLAGDGGIDAVLAVAGVASFNALTVRVNYFGAVATLESLRPLLTRSESPRAAIVASFATLQDNDPELVEAMLAGDEPRAAQIADRLAEADAKHLIYSSSKRAIAEWMRTASISDEWAGAGIPLNGVGPGVVVTGMTRPYLETAEGRASLLGGVPMPLHGPSEPDAIAGVLAYLTSAENTHVTGQVVFADGGAEATVRGPHVFDGAVSDQVVLPSLD